MATKLGKKVKFAADDQPAASAQAPQQGGGGFKAPFGGELYAPGEKGGDVFSNPNTRQAATERGYAKQGLGVGGVQAAGGPPGKSIPGVQTNTGQGQPTGRLGQYLAGQKVGGQGMAVNQPGTAAFAKANVANVARGGLAAGQTFNEKGEAQGVQAGTPTGRFMNPSVAGLARPVTAGQPTVAPVAPSVGTDISGPQGTNTGEFDRGGQALKPGVQLSGQAPSGRFGQALASQQARKAAVGPQGQPQQKSRVVHKEAPVTGHLAPSAHKPGSNAPVDQGGPGLDNQVNLSRARQYRRDDGSYSFET